MERGKKDISTRDYIIHGLYFNLYGLVKYIPSPIGDILRRNVTKLFIKRMARVRIYEGVTIWYPYRIEIGNEVSLNEWVYLSGYGGIKIGNNVRIGHRTSIITSDHIFNIREQEIQKQGLQSKPVVIEDNVWIGCNAIILGGVTIGRGAIVGAGAVVTRDVEAYAVVAGVPATKVRER